MLLFTWNNLLANLVVDYVKKENFLIFIFHHLYAQRIFQHLPHLNIFETFETLFWYLLIKIYSHVDLLCFSKWGTVNINSIWRQVNRDWYLNNHLVFADKILNIHLKSYTKSVWKFQANQFSGSWDLICQMSLNNIFLYSSDNQVYCIFV